MFRRGEAPRTTRRHHIDCVAGIFTLVLSVIAFNSSASADTNQCAPDFSVDSEPNLRLAVSAFMSPGNDCTLIVISGSFVVGARIEVFLDDLDFPTPINKSLTISGNGQILSGFDGSSGFIVYLGGVDGPHTLTIDNLGLSGFGGLGALTVIGGSTSIVNSRFSDNTYVLPDVTPPGFDDTTAGAINTLDELTVVDSEFVSNSGSRGGAISNGSVKSTSISGTTFSANHADESGGAIYATGPLDIDNSTISGNSAKENSAIKAGDDVWITFCTIVDNDGEKGAAIDLAETILTVRYSIIHGNSPSDINTLGTLDISSSWLTSSETVTVNYEPFVTEFPDPNLYGDPLLEDLGDYGGFTLPGGSTIQTRPPQANSDVIDKIDLVFAGTLDERTDQRGSQFPRVINDRADMGAVEFRPREMRRSSTWPIIEIKWPSALPDTR